MNIELPNWFLLISAVCIVIWIFAGIAAWKAANSIRRKHGDYYWTPPGPMGGRPLPPASNPHDDADWWKREG